MSAKLDINSKIKMPSGYEMPLLGYGVYQTPAGECSEVTAHALKIGYRHVDSAAAYRNEAECVEALLASGIPRSELFFTTKVPPKSISSDGAKKSVEDSLAIAGGLGYLDLVLLHSPYGGKTNRLGAWDALIPFVKAGKVRSIGVSNYGVHHLDELEAHIKAREAESPGSGGVLSVNQVELHPWMARPDIVSWCQSREVVCQAWGPLARATRLEDPKVQAVAKRLKVSEGQVLLRWSLQMGFVPLPKSVKPHRIEQNADLYGFELSKEDMQALDTGEYSPSGWDPTTSRD